MIIKSQTIDNGIRLGEAEYSRPWIPGLGAGCNRAYLDEAKTEIGKFVDMLPILVQPCCQSYRVREINAHDLARLTGEWLAWKQPKPPSLLNCIECKAVSSLRVETE